MATSAWARGTRDGNSSCRLPRGPSLPLSQDNAISEQREGEEARRWGWGRAWISVQTEAPRDPQHHAPSVPHAQEPLFRPPTQSCTWPLLHSECVSQSCSPAASEWAVVSGTKSHWLWLGLGAQGCGPRWKVGTVPQHPDRGLSLGVGVRPCVCWWLGWPGRSTPSLLFPEQLWPQLDARL